MKNFVRENWFKVIAALILLWIAISFSNVAISLRSAAIGFVKDGLRVDLCPHSGSVFPDLPNFPGLPGGKATPSFCE